MTREERARRDRKVVSMYQAGHSCSAIAEALSVPNDTMATRTVAMILERLGVPRRPRGGANNPHGRRARAAQGD